MSLPERQSELIDTHRAVQDAELPYVLVGGWAVSAFQTRFTTDIDTVVPDTALDDYDTLLRDRGYKKQFEQDVSNEYDGRMIQYTKEVGANAVKFEALVDSMGCRQTDAEWSYRYLHEHSTIESLDVAEDLNGRIPEPALLFAMKLHSGRKADTRDLVVTSLRADFDRIERHVHRGDPEKLDKQVEMVLNRLEEDGFEDSFKGVFQQEELPADAVDNLVSFLAEQRNRL
ncbi:MULTISPECIES: hypothetical protein [Halobacterium]|uniref:hypothetical protein n=1 Tax=Halobacterium TaxID=2239 RepID=UPI0019647D37|nr:MULTISPECIES: hypothetical protein [Halobacterium]MCF2164504.1 hypothetical protein [Halobacterium salinarum]MCF2168803.1 hypothetical protein [Halobacterium salinarum]MDL0121006.1 hypothetical protein [Halobacterium salinarum]QRY26113.1 hypothetical protein JRZ79_12455 [Halobacterium sp. BOL4-2]